MDSRVVLQSSFLAGVCVALLPAVVVFGVCVICRGIRQWGNTSGI